MKENFNSRKQGDIGVAAAIFHYTKQGYVVSMPLTEASRYDLIVDTGDRMLRVQCKTSSYTRSNGRSFEVQLSTSGGNQSWNKVVSTISRDECDLVFLWCANGTTWEVPVEAVEGKHSFTASWKNRQYLVGGEIKKGENQKPVPIVAQGKTCLDCSSKIDRRATRCNQHASIESRKKKIVWLPDKELIAALRSSNYRKLARTLGVSDNAIRKRLTNRGYDLTTLTKPTD